MHFLVPSMPTYRPTRMMKIIKSLTARECLKFSSFGVLIPRSLLRGSSFSHTLRHRGQFRVGTTRVSGTERGKKGLLASSGWRTIILLRYTG